MEPLSLKALALFNKELFDPLALNAKARLALNSCTAN